MEGATPAVAQAGGGSNSSVTPETGSQAASSQGKSGDSEGGHRHVPKQGHAPRQEPQQKAKPQSQEASGSDDFEEVRVGSHTMKVSKADAKVIKSLERGFHAKSQEAAGAKRQLQEAETLAKSDRKGFLKKYGIDPEEFAEMTLAEKLEEMELSPEQKELRDLKRWKAEQEQTQKEAEEQARQEQIQAEEQKMSQSLRTEMFQAWQESGLPPHPYFGKRMAATMMAAKAQGEDLSWSDAAAIVKEDFGSNARAVLEQLDGQAIQTLLGDKILKTIRDFEVARVTGQSAPKQPSADQNTRPGQKPASQQKPAMSEREWRKAFLQD